MKHDPVKRAIEQVLKNRMQRGVAKESLIIYLDHLAILWDHSPRDVDMIKTLKSDLMKEME